MDTLVTSPLTINETLKWPSSLSTLMQKSFWWWQYIVRNSSPSPPGDFGPRQYLCGDNSALSELTKRTPLMWSALWLILGQPEFWKLDVRLFHGVLVRMCEPNYCSLRCTLAAHLSFDTDVWSISWIQATCHRVYAALIFTCNPDLRLH